MKQKLQAALQQAVDALLSEHDMRADVRVSLTRPRQQAHGDYACSIAMSLAGRLGRRPQEVAAALLERVRWPDDVEGAEIAGPGFINIRLHHASEMDVLQRIVREGAAFGRKAATGKTVNIEFVSANPTGPMHVGHGRGAVVGDALAGVLAARGFNVCREYYINDAGAQIGVLAESVWLRMRELHGEAITLPEDAYPGEYVVTLARELMQRHDMAELAAMEPETRAQLLGAEAVAAMMDVIRDDLATLGIAFDVFFSERQLHESGRVQALLEELGQRGLVYEGVLPPPKGKEIRDYKPVPRLLFRTTEFGDDVDRPLAKQDGSPTYFAADIAYHVDKHDRGFDRLIDVWGADHGGYVRRVQAAMQALTGRPNHPEVVLVQMVNLMRAGRPVRMSKRSGTFITLREVVDEVGRDAVRFNFLTRRAESQLDFDLELAKQQSDENPVYYVQYAHARVCSIMRRVAAAGVEPLEASAVDVSLLAHTDEKALVAQLLGYPEVLEKAADRLEPYRIAVFLMELAAALHAYYHRHRVMVDDVALMQARLLLMRAVRQVIANGLDILGVRAPEEM